MDFGAEFDDDFFEKPKVKQQTCPKNYEPKILEPFWFMEADMKGKEASEVLLTLKHQADHHYHSKNYAKSIEAYEHCLELLPSSNTTWKREFMENIARACLKVDQPEKALEWSFKLDKLSCNADQKIVSMNLLAAVCHRLGKYAEELEALHFCLEAHKLCPEFWQRLALCYAGLFKLYLPEYSIRRTDEEEEQEPCCDFKSRMNSITVLPEGVSKPNSSLVCPEESDSPSSDVSSAKCELCMLGIQIVSSCLIRTRMLIDSGGPNQLTAQRDERLKEKIAISLKQMEVGQDFIDVASQMLGGDFSSILQRPDSTLEQHNSLTNHAETDHKSDV